ncbi:trimethylamine methyltransferase family protein [uncultured Litoreibacter sp.]|uniref:trimethylamine methyltransferase family protein n=1 Tax=uncultured Litoreibacter sp. TaxID=1392394 RepID=UPI00261E2AEE|nr:trimethylamine methyltransferase family protein [uncultured Litoreibacter sp.]
MADAPRRKGRAARLKAKRTVVTPTKVRRLIPPYAPFPEADIEALEAQAEWLLEEIGIEFRDDPEALEHLQGTGARIDGERVRFPSGLARALCETAPAQFDLHARNPAKTVTLGGDHLVFMPGYGSPFVTDLDKGRRYATLEDFQNFVRLSYMTPHLHHSGGTVVEPTDIPVSKRHLDMVLAHLTLSDKPFMGAVTEPHRAEDSLAMARIVFGDQMDSGAVIQANINVNSPLVYDATMTGALKVYAKAGQCVCISPAIFGGAMGPVTPAAMAAQTHAEIMAGIALTQAIRPGCPVVYGSFHNTMSLKTGALTFGTPEANLVIFALGQMARRLGVPFRSGGGHISGANSADGQAMAESVAAMWATVMSGTHQVWHAAGWLEGGLTMGYEKFVMDLDACGAILKMVGGMEVSEDSLSKASYHQAGPGENFLSTDHTMAHFADANFEPSIAEPGPYETWSEAGSHTAEERAFDTWCEMLASDATPPIEPSIRVELEGFVADRKATLEDEWY